jgi:hypothetical protein
MKKLNQFLMVTLSVALLFACNKPAITSSTLTGKWTLLSDSLSSGIGPSINQVYYTGQPDDYFDFRTDNKLYIKKGSAFDTLAYTITSGSTINIDTFGIIFNGVPEATNYTVSSTSAQLYTPFLVNPGAYYKRVIHLSK